MRHLPSVGVMLTPPGTTPYLVVKQDDDGATFIIELPITHEATESREDKASSNTEFINAREGVGKRVLVIDDEETILQMMREALMLRGVLYAFASGVIGADE